MRIKSIARLIWVSIVVIIILSMIIGWMAGPLFL